MPYLLYSIIIKINNLSKEKIHCSGMKLQKSSTVGKYLNSMTSLTNFNTKFSTKEIQTIPETKDIETQIDAIYQEKLLSVISKQILRCMLVKIK